MTGMSYRFQASRDGKCTHCGKPFKAGDEVFAKSQGVYLGYGCGCGQIAENEPVIAGPRETALLNDLAKFPVEALGTMIAQCMLGMARQLDEGDVSPREVTQYTKELRLGMLTLHDMYPPVEEGDETEAARQRRERRAREAGGY